MGAGFFSINVDDKLLIIIIITTIRPKDSRHRPGQLLVRLYATIEEKRWSHSPNSLKSRCKTREGRWIQVDREVKGNNVSLVV